MASSDWALLPDALGSGTVDRGVTGGIATCNGGGSFLYAMNSLVIPTNPGVVALTGAQVGFTPAAKGAQVTGCVQRGPSGGGIGWSPFLFVALQALASTGLAYMVGLSDEDPHRIKLVKGTLLSGIPAQAAATPPVQGVLAASAATFAQGTWLQLRLDAVVNLNGDVVLNVFQNDLTANSCTSPVWNPVAGISQFIDDVTQINTGSAPLVSGYAGFGASFANVTRRAFFDQLTIRRQL